MKVKVYIFPSSRVGQKKVDFGKKIDEDKYVWKCRLQIFVEKISHLHNLLHKMIMEAYIYWCNDQNGKKYGKI